MNLTSDQIAARLAERNPFTTRAVRPGAIAYRFPQGHQASDLIEVLRQNAWRGEIVGPHGSGKSTLVETLIPLLRDAGRVIQQFTLRAGESRLPIAGTVLQTWGPETQVVIDGYEQLGGWTRMLLNRVVSGRSCGLLITTHEPTGLPLLWKTSTCLETVQTVVRDIQNCEPRRVTDHDVELSFHKHEGNVREVFFELHDLYEQRR